MRQVALGSVALLILAAQDPDIRRARQEYLTALQAGDESRVHSALTALVAINTSEAVDAILGGLRAVDPVRQSGIYQSILRAACSVTSRAALEQLARFIVGNERQPFARDLAAMLHDNYSREVPHAMAILIREGTDEMKVLSVEHLANVPCAASVDVLIEAMAAERRDTLVKRKCRESLIALTGRDLGADAQLWREWWDRNRTEDFAGAERERRSTGTAVDILDRTREGEFRRLRRLKVLVLAGSDCRRGDHNLDHIDRLLGRMELQFEVVRKDQFADPAYRIADDVIAILANCTMLRTHCICVRCQPGGGPNVRLYRCTGCDVHEKHQDVLSDAGVRKVKEWVEAGGYLFTEDWALMDIVARAWPDILQPGPLLPAANVRVMPAVGAATNPYLKRIFVRPPARDGSLSTVSGAEFRPVAHTWKIDQDSPAIDIMAPDRVQVLITSPDFDDRAQESGRRAEEEERQRQEQAAQGVQVIGEDTIVRNRPARRGVRYDAVAVTFFPSRGRPQRFIATGGFEHDRAHMTGGRVVHVLSHFGKQDSQEDEYTLQNLLLNFLIEASERWYAAHPNAAPGNGGENP